MKAIIQLVKQASIIIERKEFSKINDGFLIYIGIEKQDTEDKIKKLKDKVFNMRVFKDQNGKMNLDISQVKDRSILLVSQFTLCADTSSRRPSFTNAMAPQDASIFFEKIINEFKNSGLNIQNGKFQAHMEVKSINDGPLTFSLSI